MEAQFTLQLANQSFDVLQILHAQEGIAQPFEWSLQFQSTDRLTLESWLGEPATLVLTGAWGKQRRIAGYLTQAQSLGITPDQANVIYQATLASPCALLSLQHTNRVFVNQSVIDVIRQVLTEANWVEKVHFQFRLRQDFPPCPQITQVNESDAALVQRLLAYWGLCDGFMPGPAGPQWTIADDISQLMNANGLTLPVAPLGDSATPPPNGLFKSMPNGTPCLPKPT
ncbi:MAG: phage late control D family protein [Coxiellaceae bacterium]|nr:MAG: phage late control D family protein [Coxiellaceae bacterium]